MAGGDPLAMGNRKEGRATAGVLQSWDFGCGGKSWRRSSAVALPASLAIGHLSSTEGICKANICVHTVLFQMRNAITGSPFGTISPKKPFFLQVTFGGGVFITATEKQSSVDTNLFNSQKWHHHCGPSASQGLAFSPFPAGSHYLEFCVYIFPTFCFTFF